jgi:glycosyltransferase involved in cell wall biosynthesis
MNTLLISPELFLHEGGIARILRLYLKALCEQAGPGDRVDSLVLNDRPGGEPKLPRYTNVRLGEHVACDRRKVTFVRHALRLVRQADLVICGHLHHLPIARLAQRFHPRLRYCLVAHGIEVWRPYGRFERAALLGAHRILCVSEYTRRQLLRFLPALPAERLLVVPNTLDPHFAPEFNDQLSQVPFALPRILTVGRLSSTDTYKGFDTLIEAMPAVRREYPTARLRIVGTGDDQPRLAALAAELGVAGSIDFLGALSDESLRAEYAACDLFALPSRKEGFGLVYLEAMAYGKPCVAARAGGAPEVINDSVGVLVEYGNIPDLAAAVGELVRHPRDSGVVRQHAAAFAFPAFQRRLAAALA